MPEFIARIPELGSSMPTMFGGKDTEVCSAKNGKEFARKIYETHPELLKNPKVWAGGLYIQFQSHMKWQSYTPDEFGYVQTDYIP